jgi:hypothetical protein
LEFGRRRFLSLGPHAPLAYARRIAAGKEKELNSAEHQKTLQPITWDDFTKKYFDTFYPGHDLDAAGRKEKEQEWGKSVKTMKREKISTESFKRLLNPDWCHQITAEDRENFIQKRLAEVGSALSVDADLRTLRLLCNVMEEWKDRPENSNPFSGRGKATTGARRRRAKDKGKEEMAKHYSFEQVKAILALTIWPTCETPSKKWISSNSRRRVRP